MSKKTKHPKGSTQDTTLFYAPDLLSTGILPPDESAHAIRVLRLQVGDKILVTDGKGTLYETVLLSQDPKGTALGIEQVLESHAPTRPHIHLGIAPTKSIDRIEWMLEKLIELGLDRISLIATDHTIRRQVNLDRLGKIAVSAMKQSRKLVTTEIQWHDDLEDFLSDLPKDSAKYIAHCDETSERQELKDVFRLGTDSVYLIGPEGDFSPSEISRAKSAGFVPVLLGRERLRTETAGLYVGFVHHLLNP